MRDDAVFPSRVQVPKTTSLLAQKPLINYIESIGLSKIRQPVVLWVLALITIWLHCIKADFSF